MAHKPYILVTNDDGIYAPGIYALWEAMTTLGEVTVVAPDTEKSAVGHAITIVDPIRTQPVNRRSGFQGFAVTGTPADCVKIAVRSLLDRKPDLIISGINAGANVGNNIIYSGTVSAATEGTMLGIPSIAVSLNSFQGEHWETAQKFARLFASQTLKRSIPVGTLLNVNIPDRAINDIRGIRPARQGQVYFKDRFEKREDPRGRVYYWMTGEIVDPSESEQDDSVLLHKGYVTVTPIHYQLTHESFLTELDSWELDD
ncbi:MAG: 5'/3'-nucleotidase SurE [FCB group bacterium]|nr:5'/3'-nucleotidase SurE [FCB group bacterium]